MNIPLLIFAKNKCGKPMSKHTIKSIIALMGISLVGLISLQAFWVLRDFRLAERNFDRNVKFAINRVLERFLERQITSENYFSFSSSLSSFSADSISKLLKIQSFDSNQNGSPNFKIKTKSTVIRTTNLDNIRSVDFQKIQDSSKVTIIVKATGEGKSIHLMESKKNEQSFETTSTWSSGSVFRKLRNPVSYDLLDTLLKEELTSQGLEMSFELMVWNNNTNKALYKNGEFEVKQKGDLGFTIPIIGVGNTPEQNLLWVDFPTKKAFVWKEIGFILLASVLLISVVSVCFWFAICTILNQKKLSEMKNDFINNMTHEFKTPISNVGLALEAMRNFGMMQNPTNAEKYLEIAKSENGRLGNQVEKVLQIAVLEKDDFQLNFKQINLHSIISEVSERFKIQLAEKSGSLQLNLNATIHSLTADELHLSNLISNLVDNAIKYSTGKPTIVIETTNIQNGVSLIVSDNGIGIPKSQLRTVFDKFHRVPTGNLHNVKGFGLGLSYVSEIISKHNGSIQVKSELDTGSEFEVFLPFEQ
ncbi:MAG: two-component system phosphate regulon sensor histidine kinase PhoR [Arenicella sp.]|jgi:two-component system phosphate regulon sensor histidine kinase PhoR